MYLLTSYTYICYDDTYILHTCILTYYTHYILLDFSDIPKYLERLNNYRMKKEINRTGRHGSGRTRTALSLIIFNIDNIGRLHLKE